jgi:hypothetical protein
MIDPACPRPVVVREAPIAFWSRDRVHLGGGERHRRDRRVRGLFEWVFIQIASDRECPVVGRWAQDFGQFSSV